MKDAELMQSAVSRRRTSRRMRMNQFFIRNGFPCEGEFEFPIIKREALPEGLVDLIACSRTRVDDTDDNRRKGVHFFVDDYRFDILRRNPDAGLEKFRQYAFILSPDFSQKKVEELHQQQLSLDQLYTLNLF